MRNKIIAGIASLMIGAILIPQTSSAATIQELLAQIQALQAQLALLQSQVTSTVPAKCVGITFTRDIAIGATGTDVSCLQALLNQSADTRVAVSGPGAPGSETARFGALTAAALIKFQNKYKAEVLTPYNLTANGTAGASTRGKLNAILAAKRNTNNEENNNNNNNNGGGSEGMLTVSLNSSPSTGVKAYEGNDKVSVLGIKTSASGSAIKVQRIKLVFEDVKPYDYLTKAYIYDGSEQVASASLSSSTVTKEGSDYYLMFDGINVAVSKGASKVFTVKVDVEDSIDHDIDLPKSITVSVPENGVRGTDSANLSQYGPADSISRTFKVDEEGSSSSSNDTGLSISRNTDTPEERNVATGSDGRSEGVTMLIFNIKAVRGDVTISEINNVTFSGKSGSHAIYPENAYLVDSDGKTLSSADVGNDHKVDFSDLDFDISAGKTEKFTIKADYSDVTNPDEGEENTSLVTVNSGSNIVADDEDGDSLSSGDKTGTAAGYPVSFYKSVPAFSLSKVTTTKVPGTGSIAAALEAVFLIKVTADEDDVLIPVSDAFLVKRVRNSSTSTATTNGVYTTYDKPYGVSETDGYYEVSEGSSATFTVSTRLSTASWNGSSDYYDLRIAQIDWSTYVDGDLVDNTTTNVIDTYKSEKVFLP
jgi:hypothetical protein